MKRHFRQHALKSTLIPAFVIGAAAFWLNGYAGGGAGTSNLSVTATISANCTISNTAVAFGGYDPIVTHASNPRDATGTVVTTCTSGSSPTIALDQGASPASGSSATAPVRQMASGDNRLRYELYSDAYTTVWSNTGVTTPITDGTAKINTVYGRIPGAQNKPVGGYSDTVTATVTF